MNHFNSWSISCWTWILMGSSSSTLDAINGESQGRYSSSGKYNTLGIKNKPKRRPSLKTWFYRRKLPPEELRYLGVMDWLREQPRCGKEKRYKLHEGYLLPDEDNFAFNPRAAPLKYIKIGQIDIGDYAYKHAMGKQIKWQYKGSKYKCWWSIMYVPLAIGDRCGNMSFFRWSASGHYLPYSNIKNLIKLTKKIDINISTCLGWRLEIEIYTKAWWEESDAFWAKKRLKIKK